MLGKKGVDAIVATVLIIMITVSAVAIIWSFVIPMIRDSAVSSTQESAKLSIETSGGYTTWDEVHKIARVQIKRGNDNSNLTGLDFNFVKQGNSKKNQTSLVPQPNQIKVYEFNLSDFGKPEKITVAPITASGIGQVVSQSNVIQNYSSPSKDEFPEKIIVTFLGIPAKINVIGAGTAEVNGQYGVNSFDANYNNGLYRPYYNRYISEDLSYFVWPIGYGDPQWWRVKKQTTEETLIIYTEQTNSILPPISGWSLSLANPDELTIGVLPVPSVSYVNTENFSISLIYNSSTKIWESEKDGWGNVKYKLSNYDYTDEWSDQWIFNYLTNTVEVFTDSTSWRLTQWDTVMAVVVDNSKDYPPKTGWTSMAHPLNFSFSY